VNRGEGEKKVSSGYYPTYVGGKKKKKGGERNFTLPLQKCPALKGRGKRNLGKPKYPDCCSVPWKREKRKKKISELVISDLDKDLFPPSPSLSVRRKRGTKRGTVNALPFSLNGRKEGEKEGGERENRNPYFLHWWCRMGGRKKYDSLILIFKSSVHKSKRRDEREKGRGKAQQFLKDCYVSRP